MNQQSITLISFGLFDKDLLEKVAESVGQEFRYPAKIRDAHIDLSEFYDPGRRQYNGNYLLKQVEQLVQQDSIKTIGLFNVDLFIPILTYIFGQAILGGNAGIASLYRLHNERYGLPPDKNILIERFTKEVIHEMGHTFGLIHCLDPVCVMKSSTYVEDIDLKEKHLCQGCREGFI